jgi:hypothetical protein
MYLTQAIYSVKNGIRNSEESMKRIKLLNLMLFSLSIVIAATRSSFSELSRKAFCFGAAAAAVQSFVK